MKLDGLLALQMSIQKEEAKKKEVHVEENVPAPSPRSNCSVLGLLPIHVLHYIHLIKRIEGCFFCEMIGFLIKRLHCVFLLLALARIALYDSSYLSFVTS